MKNIRPFFQQSLSIKCAGALLALLSFVWVAYALFARTQGMAAGATMMQTSVAVVSAASFETAPVAPEAIVAAFGTNLAVRTEVATTQPLPTQLAGTTVTIAGLAAPLFFVSTSQINLLIPPSTPIGSATIMVRSGDGTVSTGTVQIKAAAPAVFTANANGFGVPAAMLLRVSGDGAQTLEPIAQFDPATSSFRPLPINLGPTSDRVFLVLFLTGVRGASANTVRVLIGGQSVVPIYSGPAPGFTGLDQINAEIPRSLLGSGLIKLSVSASGSASSNEAEVEVATPSGSNPPQVTSLSTTTLLAGQELTINGANFSATMAENSVRIIGDETQPEAQILEASANRLRVLVPFGASSGKVSVRTLLGEVSTAAPVTMRTSVSGFVQDNQRQPLRGVTVRMGGTNISVQTNAEGAFLLPDAPPSAAATIEIDGTTVPGGLPYPKQQFKMRIRAERDNQVGGYIELKQATGPSITIGSGFTTAQSLATHAEWPVAAGAPEGQIQTGQVILDVPNNATVRFADGSTNGSLTLTVLESGRTPGTLPSGQFSPVIAQITPFGATITPGAKFTFPNPDGYAPNSQLRLYRFDQRTTVNGQPNPTLGTFIDSGPATVSADGQRIESAPNAVTETTYYFASGTRTTITLIGRVVENNLNRTPVRRALVNARGQGIFTDGNGGFVIRNVPVNASSAFAAQLSGEVVVESGIGEVIVADDRVGIEADFMRPSTRVDRSQHEDVPPVATGPTVSPDLVLSAATANRAPTVFAPANITMNAGTTREVTFFASDPDAGQTVQVAVSGASFAVVSRVSGDNFTLKLTPGANDGGNYTLTLTASDGQGGSNAQTISLRVNGVGLTADDQVVIVDKNTAKAIRLTGSDPLGRTLIFVIVSPPSRGTLGGTPPNVTYTPMNDYTGLDSFTFKVRAAEVESNEATVTIQVRPPNSAPVLTVPDNLSVNGGETLKFTVTASDPDAGQTLKFEALGKPEGATIIENPTSLQFSWTPTILQTRSYEITFKVTDDGTPPLSDTKRVTVTATAKWAKASGPEGGLVSSFTSANGVLYVGMVGGGVYRSSDNGQSWVAVNAGLSAAALTVGALPATELTVSALQTVGSSLYAGTVLSGVYRTSDNGQSWVAVNTGLPGLAFVYALQAVGNSLFAGTAYGVYRLTDNGQSWVEANAGLTGSALTIRALQAVGNNLFAGTSGGGVYRTSDNGQSWVAVNAGLTGSALTIRALQAVGNNLFAGTSGGGVYQTSDNGQSWVAVNNRLPTLYVYALQVVNSNLFVGTNRGVYRTSDNGQSWVAVNTGLPAFNIEALYAVGSDLFAGTYAGGVYRTSDNGQSWHLARSGISASFVYTQLSTASGLYAGTESGLYRSTDGGQTWILVNMDFPLAVLALQAVGNSLFAVTSSGVYRSNDNGLSWIRVNTLYANALQVVGNSLFAGIYGYGVYRSNDNGQSWVAVNIGLPTAALSVYNLQAVGSSLFAGTDVGVYRTSDNGQSWVAVNSGLPERADHFSIIGVGAFEFPLQAVGSSLFAGTGMGVYRTSDNGQSWVAVNTGLPAGFNPTSLYAVGSTLFVGTFGGGVYRTSDNGQSWRQFGSDLNTYGVISLASDGVRLIAGTEGNGVSVLADTGQAWSERNTNLTHRFANSITISGSSLFAGTLGGGVFRSDNQGQSWVAVNTGLPPNANIQLIMANGATLWAAAFGDGVYRSTNQGTNWTAVNTGLNNKFVNQLFTSGATLYAGTEGGVYRSLNGGDNWTLISAGMGAVPVDSFTAFGGTIYAGTDGNGVFRLNSDGVSWTRKSSGLTSQQVRSLGVNGNVLYAGTIGGGICLSRDGAETWTVVNNQMPSNLNVFAFAVSGRKVYAGSIYGVFVTENEGQSWTQINAGLLNTFVTGLAVSGDQLFASTASGGVFLSRIP